MKYAVVKNVNGAFSIASEWDDPTQTIVNFHIVCTTLWNAEDVERACVAIVDEVFTIRKIEKIKYQEQ